MHSTYQRSLNASLHSMHTPAPSTPNPITSKLHQSVQLARIAVRPAAIICDPTIVQYR